MVGNKAKTSYLLKKRPFLKLLIGVGLADYAGLVPG